MKLFGIVGVDFDYRLRDVQYSVLDTGRKWDDSETVQLFIDF
jgi:hypothetical protein